MRPNQQLPPLKKIYMQMVDGKLHPVKDQKAAAKLWRKQLVKALGK